MGPSVNFFLLNFPFFDFSVFLCWSWIPLEQRSEHKSLEVNSPRFLFGSCPNGNVSIFRPRSATTIRLIEMYLSSEWNSIQRDIRRRKARFVTDVNKSTNLVCDVVINVVAVYIIHAS